MTSLETCPQNTHFSQETNDRVCINAIVSQQWKRGEHGASTKTISHWKSKLGSYKFILCHHIGGQHAENWKDSLSKETESCSDSTLIE